MFEAEEPRALPWNTPPSGLGSSRCDCCGREIYRPAMPCSVAPPAGLLEMATAPGQGDRCKWEVTTRSSATPSDAHASHEL